jgi:hypothetical protein
MVASRLPSSHRLPALRTHPPLLLLSLLLLLLLLIFLLSSVPSSLPPFSPSLVQIQTHVPPEVTDYIVEAYVDIRNRDKTLSAKSGGRGTITARQLQSILRLSEALARLHLRTDVTTGDADEAIRLVRMSKASVDEPADDKDMTKATPMDRIYKIITQRTRENNGSGEHLLALSKEWGGGACVDVEMIPSYDTITILPHPSPPPSSFFILSSCSVDGGYSPGHWTARLH